tara:strand:- start:88 stop:363 length:276 start_codon:yes stop_codon:yes gene_type:complete
MNRKQRREIQALARKSGNRDIEEKMKLFSKLSNKCRVCDSPFDKTDINQLSEWMVIVRENERKLNLYCPPCWDQAKNAVEDLKKMMATEEK